MLWAKKQAEFKVPLRDPGEDDTAEKLEAERSAEQDKVDNGIGLPRQL